MGCRFEPYLWSQPIKSLVDSDGNRRQGRKKAKMCSEVCSNRGARPPHYHNPEQTRFRLAYCSLSKNLGDT